MAQTNWVKSSLEEWEAEWAPCMSDESLPEQARLVAIEIVTTVRTMIANGSDPKEKIWAGFKIDHDNGTIELLEAHQL